MQARPLLNSVSERKLITIISKLMASLYVTFYECQKSLHCICFSLYLSDPYIYTLGARGGKEGTRERESE